MPMQIEVMNGLSRTSPDMIQGLSRTAAMQGNYTEDEIMQGLSRIEMMSDDEYDQTMGALFGKWRARRREKKKVRRAARLERIRARGEGRAATAAAGGGWRGVLRSVGGAVGQAFGKGGDVEQLPGEIYDAVVAQTEVIPWKDRKTLGLKNPIALGVYGGGGLLIIGGTIWLATRKRKRRR